MKRMILLGAAALGLLPVCAQAHEYRGHDHRYDDHARYREYRHEYREVFRVLIRRDCHCGWQSVGTYGCRSEAEAAACHYGRCGYETRIGCD
jgi:hypothetical protein